MFGRGGWADRPDAVRKNGLIVTHGLMERKGLNQVLSL